MHRYFTEAERKRRKDIIDELQERVRNLRANIQLEEYKKLTAIDEYDRNIYEYNEDLDFYLLLLQEFGAREEDAYLSASETEQEQGNLERDQEQHPAGNTQVIQPKLTQAERQEARDKARAWHIDRKREKERTQKRK
jgi:hypothetical protein